MSSMIVSLKTMNVVVSAISKRAIHFGGLMTATALDLDALGTALYDLNRRAVLHRYPQDKHLAHTPAYSYQPIVAPTDAEALYAINDLLHQCAEGNLDQESLFVDMETMAGEIAMTMAQNTPAYQAVDLR